MYSCARLTDSAPETVTRPQQSAKENRESRQIRGGNGESKARSGRLTGYLLVWGTQSKGEGVMTGWRRVLQSPPLACVEGCGVVVSTHEVVRGGNVVEATPLTPVEEERKDCGVSARFIWKDRMQTCWKSEARSCGTTKTAVCVYSRQRERSSLEVMSVRPPRFQRSRVVEVATLM